MKQHAKYHNTRSDNTIIVKSQRVKRVHDYSADRKKLIRIILLLFAIILVFTINHKINSFDDITSIATSITSPLIENLGSNSKNASDNCSRAIPTSDECLRFDHGDISPFPNLTSVFNCNSPSGKCKWFHPAKFFNDTCGIGKKFSSTMCYMEQLRRTRELWVGAPPFVIQCASIHPGIKPIGSPGRTEILPTHNVTMLRVHKTGSSSMVKAFRKLVSKYGAKGERMVTYQPRKKGELFRRKLLGRRFAKFKPHEVRERRKESGEFIDAAVKYRRDWETKDHTLFAVVRDPAERFISAIGQATGAKGSNKNGVADQLVEECVKDTGRETLRCFVNLIMKAGTWIEVHFTPMAFEISFATMYKDIPVAVFPFNELPTILYELNADPTIKTKDGNVDGYRVREVLTKMTIEDYDNETLRDLCQIYEVDVLFLQHIGHPTVCDSCLPANTR